MIISCISASNTQHMGEDSTSTKVCHMISDMIRDNFLRDSTVNIISLMNYETRPCILCGSCAEDARCKFDDDFNKVYRKLTESDGFFFVVPHYSPIPSKLLIIMEKINEITYAGWIKDSSFQSPFANKPVAIIGHGGMVENDKVLKYYHDHLVTPVANTLKSLAFKVVPQDAEFENGSVFGLQDDDCLKRSPEAVFPDIIQDWQAIKKRIAPLVHNLLQQLIS